jgi:hypothetical protein
LGCGGVCLNPTYPLPGPDGIQAQRIDDFPAAENVGECESVVGENTQIWLIEDGWHLGGPTVVPDEYRQRMLEFFETSLE